MLLLILVIVLAALGGFLGTLLEVAAWLIAIMALAGALIAFLAWKAIDSLRTPHLRAATYTTRGTIMGDTDKPVSGEDLKGRIKEAAGNLTGDDDLEREGKLDQASAKIKDAVDTVKDKLTGND